MVLADWVNKQSHFQGDCSVLGSFIYITEVFCAKMYRNVQLPSLVSAERADWLRVLLIYIPLISAFWLINLSACTYHHLVLLIHHIPAYFANFVTYWPPTPPCCLMLWLQPVSFYERLFPPSSKPALKDKSRRSGIFASAEFSLHHVAAPHLYPHVFSR